MKNIHLILEQKEKHISNFGFGGVKFQTHREKSICKSMKTYGEGKNAGDKTSFHD